MFSRLQSHLQWRNDLLLQGRYEDLARTFVFPMVVYYGEALLHLACEDAAIGYLRWVHGALTDRCVVACSVRVFAVSLPVRNRFKVWSVRTYHGTGPQAAVTLQAVFYMVDTPHGLRSEMLEFTECSLPVAGLPRKVWSAPF